MLFRYKHVCVLSSVFLNLSVIEKEAIISDLNQLIGKFLEIGNTEPELNAILSYDFQPAITEQIEEIQNNHEEIPYDILNRNLALRDLYGKQKIKRKIISSLDDIANNHPQLDSNLVLKFLKLVLDIRDFALGGYMKAISRQHNVGKGFIHTIGK